MWFGPTLCHIFKILGGAYRRWNILVIRVTICTWKHVMGLRSPVYFNMGNILIVLLSVIMYLFVFLNLCGGAVYHLLLWHDVHTFQLKRVEPPRFSFQIVNTNMDEFSPRARRRSALLTWQHIASLPPSLPVVYCGGFNTQKESTTGRFLLGRSRYIWQVEIYLLFKFQFFSFVLITVVYMLFSL